MSTNGDGTAYRSELETLRAENERLLREIANPKDSELETLRAENARLREEIAKLKEVTCDDGRMPLAAWSAPCRLCGVKYMNGDKPDYTTTMKFEPVYNPGWLARLFGRTPHPNRVCRTCRSCGGVYWEMPSEKRFQ